jgi:LysR family tcuABC transcriptional regulator
MMRTGQLDLAVLFASDVAPDLTVEPLLEEELFVMLPRNSTLVAPRRTSLTIAEAAALPLILPTSTHGLRRRIAAEFDQRSLQAHVVAEIDSLSLLMNCVFNGMGATIKPMAAVYLERERGGNGARYVGCPQAAVILFAAGTLGRSVRGCRVEATALDLGAGAW